MKKLLSVLTALLLFNVCSAQISARSFEGTFMNKNYLLSRSVMVDGGDEMLAMGCTSPGKDRYSGNALIIKTRMDGTVLFNKEHTYNDGNKDVKSNYVSAVEFTGKSGINTYVTLGRAVDHQHLVVSKVSSITGNVITSKIINPTYILLTMATDSIVEYRPVKILFDASNDQFICVLHVTEHRNVGFGRNRERIALMLLDADLNYIQTRKYAYSGFSEETTRPGDALIYTNSTTGNKEIAIIGTIGAAGSLLSLNTPMVTLINPLYNHDAGFFARIPLLSGGLPASSIELHFYPFLYNPAFAEGLWSSSFTHYENGSDRGFYIAGFREVFIGETEPAILQVDEMGVLKKSLLLGTLSGVGNRHDIITSIHYDKQKLIMTGGRFGSVFSGSLISFNEFDKISARSVYAKSWLLDLDLNNVTAWNYGAINNFSDSVSWSTSSVHDPSTGFTHLFGNFNNTNNNISRGFLFIDDLSKSTECYKAEELVDLSEGVFSDTVLVLQSHLLPYDSLNTFAVSEDPLIDKIECAKEDVLNKTSPFNTSHRDQASAIDNGVFSITVYDLSGRLIIKDAEVKTGNQADAAIRKYLSSVPMINKDQVYIVHYNSGGSSHRIKIMLK